MWVHTLDPVLIRFGLFEIRYYSLAYIFGIIIALLWLHWLRKRNILTLSSKQIENFMLYAVLGVIVGGRLGYMLFYDFANLFTFQTFQIWQGGMSFHGGLLGVIVATMIFCRIHSVSFLSFADKLVAPTAFGLFLGRIANFINGELVGRPTDVAWCVVFPQVDELCRHPSQLYQAGKNLLMVIVLVPLSLLNRYRDGMLAAIFLIMYGVLRFFITFLREDPTFLMFSVGQYLSLATAIGGLCLLVYILWKK